MEYLVLIVLVAGFALVYRKLNTGNSSSNDKEKIIEIEKNLSAKEQEITTLEKNKDVLKKRYEEMVTELYSEPEKEIKVGSFMKDEVDGTDTLLFPRPRKTKLKEHTAVSGRNRDIRSMMVSNRRLPQTEDIPPKVFILDE